MKIRIGRLVGLGTALGLAFVMASCGGGGAKDPQDNVVTHPQWTKQALGVGIAHLYLASNPEPADGSPPLTVWLARAADGSVSFQQSEAAATGHGVTTSTRMANLPSIVADHGTATVISGAWSLIVWTENDALNPPGERNLFARLTGPGVDSGSVRVSSRYDGVPWDVTAAINQNGQARLYWHEPGRSGVNGRFINGVWTAQPDVSNYRLALQRDLVTPDGQGWFFHDDLVNGRMATFARHISAGDGLSTDVRVDHPGQGVLIGVRAVSSEGPQGFTWAGVQQASNAGSACLAVRRMVASVVQAPQCIDTSGEALANGSHVSLASHASGHAVLAWSTGDKDQTIYAARRNTAGVWSAPVKLADVTGRNEAYSVLSDLKTAIHANGQALVVFKAPNRFETAHVSYALVASADRDWSGVAEPSSVGEGVRDSAVGINSQGVPGILQRLSVGGRDSISLSTWNDGMWTFEVLRSEIRPATFDAPFTRVRLAPRGNYGWLAFWEEARETIDAAGDHDIWGAEYH